MILSEFPHDRNMEHIIGKNRSGRMSFGRFLVYLSYLILACIAISILITILSGNSDWTVNLVMSFSLGFAIFFPAIALKIFFKPEKHWQTALVFMGALGMGIPGGMWIGPWILRHFFSVPDLFQGDLIRALLICMIPAAIATYFFYTLERNRQEKALIAAERARRQAIENEALAAHLRMLQAQIEPHFLFNTLSNVIGLIDSRPAVGKAMLMNLTKYLRISLARTLPEETTLGQEMEMIRAYLDIQKIRMDERLNVAIDLPVYLEQRPFPPMLLQPLVENAVKHGLEPKKEGGDITLTVREEKRRIRVEVVDTGLGFSNFTNAGVGLTNVRERLRLLYGHSARLILEENRGQGVCAAIEVPIDADSSHYRG